MLLPKPLKYEVIGQGQVAFFVFKKTTDSDKYTKPSINLAKGAAVILIWIEPAELTFPSYIIAHLGPYFNDDSVHWALKHDALIAERITITIVTDNKENAILERLNSLFKKINKDIPSRNLVNIQAIFNEENLKIHQHFYIKCDGSIEDFPKKASLIDIPSSTSTCQLL